MSKAFIQTFGCQMNEHDSLRMKELLKREGYSITQDIQESDLIILNSCSVREGPENKIYSQVGRLNKLKKSNPNLILGIAGCVAQQEGKDILKRHKSVDMVFGPDQIFHLAEMLAEVRAGKRVHNTDWMPREKKIQNFIPPEELTNFEVEGAVASIAITKGCNNYCSFCIVPTTRGRLVSREVGNIIEEAKVAIQKGAKEILLLGQNVNSYQAGNSDFHSLLKTVADLEGLHRLRFTSPHPNDWTSELTDLMASHPVICNSLHLPFQSGGNRILELMKRDHTKEDYLAKIEELYQKIPDLGLSSDIIVGFPTETEEEFQATIEIMKKARFYQVYAFKYSPRPGTKANQLEDDIPRGVKDRRLAEVLELNEQIQGELLEAQVGSTHEILIDAAHPKERGVMNGRNGANYRFSVEGDQLEIGDFITVKVIEKRKHSLWSRQIN